MRAIKSNVVVKKLDGLTQKVGGLEIRVGVGEYELAEVLSVGLEVDDHVSEGDVVYVYPNSGKRVTEDGVDYFVINISEIISIKD